MSLWRAITAPDGRVYYANLDTDETTWTLPPGAQLAPQTNADPDNYAVLPDHVRESQALAANGGDSGDTYQSVPTDKLNGIPDMAQIYGPGPPKDDGGAAPANEYLSIPDTEMRAPPGVKLPPSIANMPPVSRNAPPPSRPPRRVNGGAPPGAEPPKQVLMGKDTMMFFAAPSSPNAGPRKNKPNRAPPPGPVASPTMAPRAAAGPQAMRPPPARAMPPPSSPIISRSPPTRAGPGAASPPSRAPGPGPGQMRGAPGGPGANGGAPKAAAGPSAFPPPSRGGSPMRGSPASPTMSRPSPNGNANNAPKNAPSGGDRKGGPPRRAGGEYAAAPVRPQGGETAVRALYDYTNGDPNFDLKFRKGDIIMVTKCPSAEGWWEGFIGDRKGLFPSSFVEFVDESMNPFTEKNMKNLKAMEAQQGNAQGGTKGGPFVVADSNYTAAQPGDVTLEKGDFVKVIDSSDPSGWWRGLNVRTGLSGVVPSNFVRACSPEELKMAMSGAKSLADKGGNATTNMAALLAGQSVPAFDHGGTVMPKSGGGGANPGMVGPAMLPNGIGGGAPGGGGDPLRSSEMGRFDFYWGDVGGGSKAAKIVRDQPDGSYILRDCSQRGAFAFTYIDKGKVLHALVHRVGDGYKAQGHDRAYATMELVVENSEGLRIPMPRPALQNGGGGGGAPVSPLGIMQGMGGGGNTEAIYAPAQAQPPPFGSPALGRPRGGGAGGMGMGPMPGPGRGAPGPSPLRGGAMGPSLPMMGVGGRGGGGGGGGPGPVGPGAGPMMGGGPMMPMMGGGPMGGGPMGGGPMGGGPPMPMMGGPMLGPGAMFMGGGMPPHGMVMDMRGQPMQMMPLFDLGDPNGPMGARVGGGGAGPGGNNGGTISAPPWGGPQMESAGRISGRAASRRGGGAPPKKPPHKKRPVPSGSQYGKRPVVKPNRRKRESEDNIHDPDVDPPVVTKKAPKRAQPTPARRKAGGGEAGLALALDGPPKKRAPRRRGDTRVLNTRLAGEEAAVETTAAGGGGNAGPTCVACDAALAPNSKFCEECGTRVDAGAGTMALTGTKDAGEVIADESEAMFDALAELNQWSGGAGGDDEEDADDPLNTGASGAATDADKRAADDNDDEDDDDADLDMLNNFSLDALAPGADDDEPLKSAAKSKPKRAPPKRAAPKKTNSSAELAAAKAKADAERARKEAAAAALAAQQEKREKARKMAVAKEAQRKAAEEKAKAAAEAKAKAAAAAAAAKTKAAVSSTSSGSSSKAIREQMSALSSFLRDVGNKKAAMEQGDTDECAERLDQIVQSVGTAARNLAKVSRAKQVHGPAKQASEHTAKAMAHIVKLSRAVAESCLCVEAQVAVCTSTQSFLEACLAMVGATEAVLGDAESIALRKKMAEKSMEVAQECAIGAEGYTQFGQAVYDAAFTEGDGGDAALATDDIDDLLGGGGDDDAADDLELLDAVNDEYGGADEANEAYAAQDDEFDVVGDDDGGIADAGGGGGDGNTLDLELDAAFDEIDAAFADLDFE